MRPAHQVEERLQWRSIGGYRTEILTRHLSQNMQFVVYIEQRIDFFLIRQTEKIKLQSTGYMNLLKDFVQNKYKD